MQMNTLKKFYIKKSLDYIQLNYLLIILMSEKDKFKRYS